MVLIAHLADIHIQDRRRGIYAEIFDQLYIKLKECNVDLIVVAGDIFDNKMRASANNLADVTAFLTNLSNIAPVVAIAGNHDTNCLVPDSLDLLTPLLRENRHLQPPRFNYWRYSGVYYAHDIIWSVIATDGEQPSEEIEQEVKSKYPGKTHICLFHEEVNNAKMPNGSTISNFKLNFQTFDRYDFSMGGHIHNRQIFTPTAAYCGSLIQQNIGESVTGHGFLIWNTITKEISGVDIISDRGFIRIHIDENGNDVTIPPIPKNPEYWEVVYLSNTVDAEIIQNYTKQFGSQPRAVRYLTNETQTLSTDIEENNIHNIQISAAELQTHETIIREILGNDEIADGVMQLHKERYIPQQYISGGKFRLLNIAFDNMYAFGVDNYVDFTKLEKCVSGVIAPNHTGKSSLIDTILFALYDEHPRSSVKKDIVNVDAQICKLRLEFELDGKTGFIEKGFSIKNKSAITGMYKFSYAGEELTQGSATATIAEIKRVLGSAEIALSSSFQIQGGEYSGFVTASPSDRKRILANVLSLGVFDEIEKNVSKEMTAAGAEVKTLEKQGSNVNIKEQLDLSVINLSELEELEVLQSHIQEVKLQREQLIYKVANYKEYVLPEKYPEMAKFDSLTLEQIDEYVTSTLEVLSLECGNCKLVFDPTPTIQSGPIQDLRNDIHETFHEITQLNRTIGELNETIFKLEKQLSECKNVNECEFELEWQFSKMGEKPDIDEFNSAIEFTADNNDLYKLKNTLFSKSEKWNMARYAYLKNLSYDGTETMEELISAKGQVLNAIKINMDSKIKALNTAETLGQFAENALIKYPNIVHKTIENPAAQIELAKEALSASKHADRIVSRWTPAEGCKKCSEIHTIIKSAETVTAEANLAALETQLEKYKAGQLRKVKDVIAKKINAERELQKEMDIVLANISRLESYNFAQKEIVEIEEAKKYYDQMIQVAKYIDILERAFYHCSNAKTNGKIKYMDIKHKLDECTTQLDEKRNRLKLLNGKHDELRAVLNLTLQQNSSVKYIHQYLSNRARSIYSAEFNRITADLAELERVYATKSNDIEYRKINRSRLEAQYEIELKRVAELNRAQLQYNILKAYKSILRPNGGIADKLLESARTTFNRRLNEALRELGAKFIVDINDKFELHIASGQNSQFLPASLASGYQKFVLGLAARLAIWRLSAIPRPDAFIIDEGFGACDEDYLELMANALESLSAAPDGPKLVFIVSHVDMLKTRLERSIDLITGPPTKVDTRVSAEKMAVVERKPPQQVIIQQEKQFWCEDCQQQLKSAATFDKHLISAKHIKNSQKK